MDMDTFVNIVLSVIGVSLMVTGVRLWLYVKRINDKADEDRENI